MGVTDGSVLDDYLSVPVSAVLSGPCPSLSLLSGIVPALLCSHVIYRHVVYPGIFCLAVSVPTTRPLEASWLCASGSFMPCGGPKGSSYSAPHWGLEDLRGAS